MRANDVRARTAAIIVASFVAAPGAALAEDCHDEFSPDRPGATNGHATVGFGCVLIESAAEITRSRGETDLAFPQLARIGVASFVEARIGYDVVDVAIPDAGSAVASPADSTFEFKIMAVHAKDRYPGLGMTAGVVVPGVDASSATVEPSTTLLFDWEFVENWSLGLNLLFSEPPAESPTAERSPRLGYAAVLQTALPVPDNWLSAFVDGQGGSTLDHGAYDQSVGAGAAFLVRSNVQLDISFEVEVTGHDHPVVFGPGFAWRL